MIAIDANTLIQAAKYHEKLGQDMLQRASAARLLSQRKTRNFVIPESVAGEVLRGAKSEKEFAYLCEYIQKLRRIEISRIGLAKAARLIQQYPERKARKFRWDALAYATASSAGADAFCTFDRGFIGEGNRVKLKNACAAIHLRHVEPHSAHELLTMTHINPQPSKKPRTRRKVDEVTAHRNRAFRRAAAEVGNDFMDQARYFIGVARAYGFAADK